MAHTRSKFPVRAGVGVFALLASGSCFAHADGTAHGLLAGLIHPVAGLDHLLALVAVGIWAATRPPTTGWKAPALYLALLAVGATLGTSLGASALVEAGIVVSLFALAGLVAAARHVPAGAAFTAVGAFALFHGVAHGAEASGGFGLYLTGFLLTSALLHATGYLAGRRLVAHARGLLAGGLALALGGFGLILT